MSRGGHVDVLIAGGGPAGAATAIALRQRGIDCLLVDRAAFPRDKVCGDVLLPEARAGLRALNLDLSSLQQRTYACTGVRYAGAKGPQVSGDFRTQAGPQPWWMIRRRDFDDWLLAQACRAGADVVEKTAVAGVIRENGVTTGVTLRSADGRTRTIKTRVVVGADGASSVVAREVGAFSRPPEHTCLAARAYVRGIRLPAPYLEVFTTPRVLPGCAWIVPIGPDEANVGIGMVQATAQRLGCTPQAMMDALISESPLLSERLQGCDPLRLDGWVLPAATEGRRLAGMGWVLVGDAGAMVDPFTGHGIQNAIVAGAMAATAIGDAISTGDLGRLAAYETQCRQAFAPEVDRGWMLQQLHARPRLVDAAIRTCASHPGLRGLFLSLVGHAEPRRALLAGSSIARAAVNWRSPGAAA